MVNLIPLVYNFDYNESYFPETIISPILNNPYLMSSNIGPFRTHISPLGTAADDLVLSPVNSILSAPYSPIGYNQVDYLNVNNDPDLIKNVTKYFFEKTMNAWMYSDFEDLLTFLVIKNNKVSVISNKKELENNKRDTDINLIEMKVDFITNHVMSKYDMKSFLKKYALKSGLDLWKLKENKSYVKKSIYKKIKSRLEKLAYH
jgi:hypothetical protein